MKMLSANQKAPALERGLKVLELLADEGSELGLKSIAQKLNIPVPSLWRILGVLRENGYVLFDPDKKTYRLGFKFLYLGNVVLNRIGFRSQARGYLKRLVELTGETAELSARIKDQLILIEQVEGPEAVRLFSRVGSAYPYFHATAPGKVYLAHIDRDKLTRVMTRMGLPKITKHTVTRLDVLADELKLIAERGFASDTEEMREGVCRIASPVYDKTGKIVACLGIAAPAFRIKSRDYERIGNIIKDLAQELTDELHVQNGPDWLAFQAF
ncbi:MAG: IclR family transcriptional regulator [Deltaproteobacteria bacterium]|nr:IclR family transcriptional regulator [Deltaproteobacteria bacterium]